MSEYLKELNLGCFTGRKNDKTFKLMIKLTEAIRDNKYFPIICYMKEGNSVITSEKEYHELFKKSQDYDDIKKELDELKKKNELLTEFYEMIEEWDDELEMEDVYGNLKTLNMIDDYSELAEKIEIYKGSEK